MSTTVSFATIQTTFPSGDEDHYRESVELLGAGPLLPYRGRAHLAYG